MRSHRPWAQGRILRRRARVAGESRSHSFCVDLAADLLGSVDERPPRVFPIGSTQRPTGISLPLAVGCWEPVLGIGRMLSGVVVGLEGLAPTFV